VADLERLLADHPFRERSVGLLLRALAAAGRQTDALTRYLEHRRRLTDEFGIEPSVDLQHLYVELLRADDGRSPAGPPLPLPSGGEDPSAGRLPSFHTRWYGRERESERLVGVLFRGGVSFVDLAPILDAALVPRAAAGALGIDLGSGGTATPDILVQALAEERVLLVLDNCEHVLGACADLVSRLREDCAGLTVLATSRAPLGLDGEQRWPIGPLALPAGDLVDGSASMQLLVDRTRAVRRGFGINDDNRDALASICHHLDGLPLAIELVAAQLAHLSPVETAGRLAEHATTLLRGQRRIPRHRTLEATIRWSYDLLSGPQRALLRRLSVFVGGATLGSITAVARHMKTRRSMMAEPPCPAPNQSRTRRGSRGARRAGSATSLVVCAAMPGPTSARTPQEDRVTGQPKQHVPRRPGGGSEGPSPLVDGSPRGSG
jgi:hypothetical protein